MNAASKTRSFSLNDLPAYSPWPARLLGLEPWQAKHKTPAEVTREFDRDKWGALLARVEASGDETRLEQVETWAADGIPDALCSVGDEFELLSSAAARKEHLGVVRAALRPYLPASALVELGAGYGSAILNLANDAQVAGIPLFAGEYVASGVELIRRLAAAQHTEITVGNCDLGSIPIANFAIPAGALLFTCMAAHYVPNVSPDVIRALASLRPAAVVHVEPCYEHCDTRTLLGALRRRYIEINDYNRNLITVLHQQQEAGMIRVIEESPAVFGCNPLLPVSVVVWTPTKA